MPKEGDWWNPTIKTIYDPCPNGYRIPENGTYNNLTLDTFPWTGSGLTAGRTFKNLSFFPASGYRTHSSGLLSNMSSHGFAWMSTPYNPTNGRRLTFHYSAIIPTNTGYRSEAIPIRCIKEQ